MSFGRRFSDRNREGGDAEHRPERAGEGFVAFIPAVEGDFRHRRRAQLEPAGRALQTQAPDVPFYRLADHAGENPMKMAGRKTRLCRQLLQFERVVQVSLNMNQHPQNAALVILQRGLSHGLSVDH